MRSLPASNVDSRRARKRQNHSVTVRSSKLLFRPSGSCRYFKSGHVCPVDPSRSADFANAREIDGETNLIRFVVTRTLHEASPEYWTEVERDIKNELTRGACMVLLDGLDEVGADANILPVLSTFINEYGQNYFVLTSRMVGLDSEPWRKLGFNVFQVNAAWLSPR